MKPPVFDYAAPATLAEATALLVQYEGDAKVLSGGQSLVPLLNMRLARPAMLVDLARVPDLDYVRSDGAGLAIGAMTRQRTVELSPLVQAQHPMLHAGMLLVAHPQNRNQGTVGDRWRTPIRPPSCRRWRWRSRRVFTPAVPAATAPSRRRISSSPTSRPRSRRARS